MHLDKIITTIFIFACVAFAGLALKFHYENKPNDKLLEEIRKKDSIISMHEKNIKQFEVKIDSLNEKRKQERKYYEQKISDISSYNSFQLDSAIRTIIYRK